MHIVIPRNTFGEKKKGNWMPGAVVAAEASPERKLGNEWRRRSLCVSVHETGWCRRECKILRREGATIGGRRIQNPRPIRSGLRQHLFRRAFLLSDIWSLLLGTLPQVDDDNEGEIRYPCKNLNVANSDSHTDKDPKTDRNSVADSHPDPDYTNSWEPCIPEPNLKEEPL